MHLWAYIDAGSGSMLIQVLLAGILAVPFFFRRTIADVWHRVRGGEPAAEDPATSPSEEGESGR
jgi:hypothetical protein